MTSSKPATFGQGRGVRPGDDIVVVGFPLHGLLTSDPSVTTGNVSALAGPGDDRRFLQITAPVQQGNSGGPLLDLAKGKPTGVYTYQGAVANRALELLGKDLGMFVERKVIGLKRLEDMDDEELRYLLGELEGEIGALETPSRTKH